VACELKQRDETAEALKLLDEILEAPANLRQSLYHQAEATLKRVRDALEVRASRSTLASLRLKESLVCEALGLTQQAFAAAHEAWVLVADRVSPAMQALMLSQLARCYELRGDLRAAVRAARRAEALIVAECGEDLPQTLAVRAQLVHLLERTGRPTGTAILRRDRSLELLRRSVRNPDQRDRFLAFLEEFSERPDPAPWSWLYQDRWRHVPR
jgi:hypothetical protein